MSGALFPLRIQL